MVRRCGVAFLVGGLLLGATIAEQIVGRVVAFDVVLWGWIS